MTAGATHTDEAAFLFDAKQARHYFEMIHDGCSGVIEVRPIDEGGKVELRAWAPTTAAAVEACRRAARARLHVYAGIATRRSSKSGGKDNLAELRSLYIDADCKEAGDRERYEAAIEGFSIPPSLVVWSGGGFHVYWLLLMAIDLSLGANVEHVEEILRGLAVALGSDPSVAEVARILRPPGAINVKRGDGRTPTPVRLLAASGKRYAIEEFSAFAELGRPPEVPPAPRKALRPAGCAEDRPGDHFARSMDWRTLLADRGFQLWKDRGDYMQWTRPGKAHGVSVTVIHDLLWVFTSSIPQLEPNTSYSKFGFFVAWDFGGDHAAGARYLAAHGFGAAARSTASLEAALRGFVHA